MERYSILVADSSASSRGKICNMLRKKGYRTFQASEGSEAIRMARSIRPTLVIMDMKLWGINPYSSARVIEQDKLSTVVFMTDNISGAFYEKLRYMNIFAYIMKPVNPQALYNTVEFSIMNTGKIILLAKKVEKLESTIEGRKRVDRAKGILMDRLRLSENEAYGILRRKSMDRCISIEKMAEIIINKHKEDGKK